MNKKIYLSPSIEVVELQGNVVLNTSSGTANTLNDTDGGSSITVDDEMSSGSASGARSSSFSGVWDDE